MSIDWDRELLAPIMSVFGEGQGAVPASWPLYMPAYGDPFRVEGAVYDDAYQLVTLGDDGAENTTTSPCLGVRRALFAQPPKQRDRVDIVGRGLFVVKDVRDDGHGHVRLILMGPLA